MNDKNLNIIFFVDANRTRRFQLSIKQLIGISVLFFATTLWAILSIFYIYRFYTKDGEQFTRITELQTAIFNYQTRYENIYEKAYSIDEPFQPIDENTIDRESIETDTTTTSEKSTKPRKELAELTKDRVNDKNPKISKKAETPDAELDNIQITSIKTVRSDKDATFTVWYSIKNKDTSNRAVGYVVGNAYLISENGDQTVLQSPENWLNTAEYESFSKKHRYKIKRFKRTNMIFQLPQSKKGFISKVDLIVISKNGGRKVITHNIGQKKNNE